MMWGQFEDIEGEGASKRSSTNNAAAVKEEEDEEQEALLPPPLPKDRQSSVTVNKHLLNALSSGSLDNSPSCPNFGSLEAAHVRVSSTGLTFSEAKEEIWKLRKKGPLIKRGFYHRKLWVERFVVLSGRMLNYYETKPDCDKDLSKPRGMLMLKPTTVVVSVESTDGRFLFNVIPDGVPDNDTSSETVETLDSNKTTSSSRSLWGALFGRIGSTCSTDGHDEESGGLASYTQVQSQTVQPPLHQTVLNMFRKAKEPVWRLQASSEVERRRWITMIRRSVSLIRRVEVGPTLVGVGRVHDHYKLLGVISNGSFGQIREAVAANTGERYAVKIVKKDQNTNTEANAKKLRNEIRIMRRASRKLDHTNICKLYQAFEDSFMVYLVMERLTGDSILEGIVSDSRLGSSGVYSEQTAADCVRQVASALKELHGVKIVLRNLSPSSFRFTDESNKTLKVSNFACAQIYTGPENRWKQNGRYRQSAATVSQAALRKSTEQVGTVGFIAPEVLSESVFKPACDIWALGCILFMMLVGYPPFVGDSQGDVMLSTLKGLQPKLLKREDWKGVSTEARGLLGAMLNLESERRITADSILSHEWLKPQTRVVQLDKAKLRIQRLNRKNKQKKQDSAIYALTSEDVMSPTVSTEPLPSLDADNVSPHVMTAGEQQVEGTSETAKTRFEVDKEVSPLDLAQQAAIQEEMTAVSAGGEETNGERSERMYRESSRLLLDVYAQQVRQRHRSLSDQNVTDEATQALNDNTSHMNNDMYVEDSDMGEYKSKRARDPGRFLNLLEQKLQEAAETQDPESDQDSAASEPGTEEVPSQPQPQLTTA